MIVSTGPVRSSSGDLCECGLYFFGFEMFRANGKNYANCTFQVTKVPSFAEVMKLGRE